MDETTRAAGPGSEIDELIGGHGGRLNVHAGRLAGHDDQLADLSDRVGALEQGQAAPDAAHTMSDVDGANAIRLPAEQRRPGGGFPAGSGAARTQQALAALRPR
jgi:hypothetical protein